MIELLNGDEQSAGVYGVMSRYGNGASGYGYAFGAVLAG
jgi:hypothetical protein